MNSLCAVSHCSRVANSSKPNALCDGHYQIKYRGVDPELKQLPPVIMERCWVENCTHPASVKNLCKNHFRQARLKKISVPEEFDITEKQVCIFPECEELESAGNLCHKHYNQATYSYKGQVYGKYTNGQFQCQIDDCDRPASSKDMCKKHAALARTYGLTLQEICDLPKMCENPGCKNTVRLHIDHDHVTGKVRGVLCQTCNTSFGLLREDIRRIQGLAEYKKIHS